MKIVKTATHTKTYQVQMIKRNFCKFDESFRRIRLKFHHDKSMECFNCEYAFQDGDNINIFFMGSDGNKLCCDKCADEQEGSDANSKTMG